LKKSSIREYPRVGDDQHQIVFLQYAQVPVLSFAGVKKYGRSPGRAKCGSDIHGYLPGFSHSAGNEFPSLSMYLLDDKFDGLYKLVCDRYIQNGLSLFT
jgi:hypothetical protein